MENLYENIKKRRLKLGMTQTDLANTMGYSDKSMISRIEAGKVDLSQSKILEFANALKIDAKYLMGLEKPKQEYYLDPDAAKIAQEVFARPELKTLFDASKDVSPDDIILVAKLLAKLKKKGKGDY